MKRIKSIWLALVIIFCFLIIQVRYNSSSYSAIFFGLVDQFVNQYTFLFLIAAIFLMLGSLTKSKWLIILGIASMITLLLWLIFSFNGVLEFYLFSVVPFLLACTFTILYLFLQKPEKFDVEG